MQIMNDSSWVCEMKNIKGPNIAKDLREFLFDGEVEIKFEKKDGTERVMRCTLHPDLIPEAMMPKGDLGVDPKATGGQFLGSIESEQQEYMRVFDIEAQGWRSFVLANLKYVKTNYTAS